LKTVAAKLYEGMFLVDSALAASDWQGVNDTIRSILEKTGAEIVSINKWDERKLTYDIMGKSRGTYILTYFRVDGSKIAEIERAVQLSENIMRVLVLSIEDIDAQHLAKETPATAAQSQAPNGTGASADDRQRNGGDQMSDVGQVETKDAIGAESVNQAEVADAPRLWRRSEDKIQ